MKTLFENQSNIGEAHIRLWRHEDDPGQAVVEITRGGIKEDSLSPSELDTLALACKHAVECLRLSTKGSESVDGPTAAQCDNILGRPHYNA